MNYILVISLLLIGQNDASDDTQNRRNINDSFDINIGAGYAVGLDQTTNHNPPNGTSNISLTKNYYPSNSGSSNAETIPRTSVRGPRILTNFTPQVGNPISDISKNHGPQSTLGSTGYKDHYSASPSNIHSYNAPGLPASSDEHFEETNLVDFQKILNEVESKKPFSKVLQVIKVPAIYEIHFQSDENSQKKVNLNPTGNLFWKDYYENKFNTSSYFDDYSKWVNSAQQQEEDDKWLNNVQVQEAQLSKDGEKYYDFSDIPVVSYENLHESFDNKPKGNSYLLHTVTHHHSNTKTVPNFDSSKDARTNYNSESFSKPWVNKDYPRNKKPYAVNNFKRHVVYNQRGSNLAALLQNENVNSLSSNPKNTAPFKQNQIITENDKPQALHEVPAPYLGKYPQPKPFEVQKLSDLNSYPKIIPTANALYKQTKVKFNKLSPSNTKSGFNYKDTTGFLDPKASNSFGKKNTMKPEALIYGKKSEHVLTPYEINIPVTPGSTMVTVTENPYNGGRSSLQSFQHSTNIKRNTNSIVSEKPGTSTFNDHYKQVSDLRQQSSKKVDQTFLYPANSKSDKNVFSAASSVNQNTSPYHETSVNGIKFFSSEKSVIPDHKLSGIHEQVPDLPYQTQKSISAENMLSTTPSSDVAFVKTNTLMSTPETSEGILVHTQSEQTTGKEIIDRTASPTFSTKQSSRRRAFYHNGNRNLNNYINSGPLKNTQRSRFSRRKSNDPRLDSIIYITRKSTD